MPNLSFVRQPTRRQTLTNNLKLDNKGACQHRSRTTIHARWGWKGGGKSSAFSSGGKTDTKGLTSSARWRVAMGDELPGTENLASSSRETMKPITKLEVQKRNKFHDRQHHNDRFVILRHGRYMHVLCPLHKRINKHRAHWLTEHVEVIFAAARRRVNKKLRTQNSAFPVQTTGHDSHLYMLCCT